jgi:hypothetical protein
MVLRSEHTEALVSLVEELSTRLDNPLPKSARLGNPLPKSGQRQETDDERISELKYPMAVFDYGEFFDTARIIDFREKKLPAFVGEITGFSFSESFGRWTDSDIARVVFSHPLPITFSIEITMMAHGPNVNQPALVVAGGDAKTLVPTRHKLHRYQMKLYCRFPGKMIEFFIPHALSPRHLNRGSLDDSRRIGFGIQSITIKKRAKSFSQTVTRLPVLRKAREKMRALLR